MSREQAKKNKQTKKLVFIVGILLAFGLTFLAYTVSYATIDISPNEQQVISDSKPNISVNWPYALGARLKRVKVVLDGENISKKINIKEKGFDYQAEEKLAEGVHVVEAELEYDLLYSKKINLRWFFSTDTTPPQITLKERDNTLASKTNYLHVKGDTEPLSELAVVFNGKKARERIIADKKGIFEINIRKLKKKNYLLLMAKDRAGNITKRKLNIIIDNQKPVIKKIVPADGGLFFSASQKRLQVVFKDNESGVSKALLKINGKVVKTNYDKKKDTLTFIGSFGVDGVHEAYVEVGDVAGNKTSKKWRFNVDTSKIIVDQSDCKLYFYKGRRVHYTVGVAVGRPAYPTPNGNWEVVRKKSMPSWYNPRKSWSASMPTRIGPGSSNPLGLRAIYLSASGIRIHGTSSYYSIGHRASHGCIRVRNADVVVLFPKVRVGTPVLIRP